MKQLKELILMNFKEFYREPGIIFWAILFPIILAIGLGFAFSENANLTRKVALVKSSLISSEKHSMLQNNSFIEAGNNEMGITTYHLLEVNWEGAIQMIKKGKTSIIIQLGKDSLTYHFDPSNPEAKLAYLQLSNTLDGDSAEINSGNVNVLSQTGTRYIDFLLPGLLGMGIMMNCMWGVSYSNVNKRSKMLLRRMVATPMRKTYYILAQFIARLLLSLLEGTLLFTITYLVFEVPITGSIAGILLLYITGNFAFTGIAMLTSSRTSNPQVANGLINLVILPMMLLSGIYFSYHNFPEPVITIIELLPLTLIVNDMRAIFLEGAGFASIIPVSLVLTGVGVVFFVMGLRIYKWY